MRIASIILILVALGIWAFWTYGGPAAPTPRDMDQLDPLVAAVIKDGVDAVNRSRRNHDLRVQLGMVYEANGHAELARECYRQVIRSRQEDPKLWYRLALASHRAGDVPAALEALGRVIDIDPPYPPASWRTGLWLFDQGHFDRAEAALRRAIEISPREEAAWYGLVRVMLQTGRPDEAVTILEERLLGGSDRGYAAHLAVTAYQHAGRAESAARAARTAQPALPRFPDAWADEAGRYRTGYAALREAAAQLTARGRFQEAVARIEVIREGRGEDASLLSMLGVCEIGLGQHERGLATLRRAVELEPANVDFRLELARAYLRTGDDSAALSLAEDQVRAAMDADPSSGKAVATLGSILRRRGNLEGAIVAYRQGFELDGRDLLPLIEAGTLELQMARWRDAARTFLEVLENDPAAGNAHVGLAVVLMNQRTLDEAAAALDRAAELESTTPARLADARRMLRALREQSPGGQDER